MLYVDNRCNAEEDSPRLYDRLARIYLGNPPSDRSILRGVQNKSPVFPAHDICVRLGQ